MLFKLFIHLFLKYKLQFKIALEKERRRLRLQNIYTFSDLMFHPWIICKFTNRPQFDVFKINLFSLARKTIKVLAQEFFNLHPIIKIISLLVLLLLKIFLTNLILSPIFFFKSFYKQKKFLFSINSDEYFSLTDSYLNFFEKKFIIFEFINNIILLAWQVLFGILIIIPILLIVAYSTLLERKILASAQKWRGPNKVGIKGSVQPLVDGIKLIIKEIIVPVQSENKIFILASKWSIFFMLLLWFVVPTSPYGNILEFDYEILALFCISVLGSISILLAGWSSNSKYSFLGGVRAGAQMISYELILGLLVLIIMTVTSSTQIIDIVQFQEIHGNLWKFLPFETILFIIIIIAETNRAPFDFAEAESELVSGYNTEYSGLPFAFFFIAEYGNILYMSLLTVLFFWGGWSTSFLPYFFQNSFFIGSILLFFKSFIIYFIFLWLRATLPRFRYDQLMSLCWKIFLPLTLVCLMLRISMYSGIYIDQSSTDTDMFELNTSSSILEIKNLIYNESYSEQDVDKDTLDIHLTNEDESILTEINE